MINTIQTKEYLNQVNGINVLQEEAKCLTRDLRNDLEETKETEKRISILKQKKIKKDVEEKNSEIYNKEIKLKHNGKKIDNLKTLSEVLKSDKESEEKVQIIIESIHGMDDRVDLKSKKNIPFYCGDRALLLYQIFKENKDILGIKKHSIALPYGHVMNIVKIGDKTYISDAGAGCFNEITNNFKIQKKGEWEVIKLKEPIKLYKNSNKFYGFTSFPTTKNLGNNEFLYTSINIQMFEYYVTNKLYEIARSTKGYENTESIQDLEKFLKEILYQKENPYEGILEDGDVLLTFPKDQQIKMIEGQIYHRLSYQENKNTLNDLENISKKISEDNSDYDTKYRENFLGEFYKDDKNITTALNISDEEKGRILQILISENQEKEDTKEMLTKKIINRLTNFNKESKESLLGQGNEELETKLINFLKALNLRANQANSSLENELENIFKNT